MQSPYAISAVFSQSSATAPKSKPNTLTTKDISELRDKLHNY
jgi:hypothetical protein